MRWVMLALVVGVGVVIAMEIPQIVRYVKIERM
jgi:hypothetical protein